MAELPQLNSRLPAALEEFLMDWLTDAGPDGWHMVARGWNWDSGCRVLGWICSQAECDKATAQLVFVRSWPDQIFSSSRLLEFAKSLLGGGVYYLGKYFLARWREGAYKRAEICLDAGEMNDFQIARTYLRYLSQFPDEMPDWSLPDNFVPKGVEATIPRADGGEGIPSEVWERYHANQRPKH